MMLPQLFLPAPARGMSRRSVLSFFAILLAVVLCSFAHAEDLTKIQVRDTSALRPPTGARVAIVEFGDLECPACANANPLLIKAAATYKIPWVRHDQIIPGHIWSPTAATVARWLDGKSAKLGDEYRNQVFANQNSIETLVDLNRFNQRFAAAHGVALPFAIDPQGKLASAVQADTDLGRRLGVIQTPTIFIVTTGAGGPGYTQVLNVERDLYRDIDAAMAATRK